MALLQELKLIQESYLNDQWEKFYESTIKPLESNLENLKIKADVLLTKLKIVEDDPEIKKQYAKIQDEIEKITKMITEKYNVAGKQFQNDKSVLDLIGRKLSEMNDWTKDNLNITLGSTVGLAVIGSLLGYLIADRKRIKKKGL